MRWERERERRALENILGLAGLGTIVIPAVLLAMAVFTAVSFAFVTAAILIGIGMAIWFAGNCFLEYLQEKLKEGK